MGGVIPIPQRTTQPKLTDYSIGSIIGVGGFGKVREIRRRDDNEWFALKILEFNKLTINGIEMVINELNMLKNLPSHQFIIRYYATFRDQHSLSFVMDLLCGGDLRLILKLQEKINEYQSAYIIACIGSALHHIHLHRIIHRDVKPENIMLDGHGIPKLIDFGISHCFPSSTNDFICELRSGTPQYISPEAAVPNGFYHSYETDYWSLGVVLYEILFHKRPPVELMKELVKYSDETYHSTWITLRSLQQAASSSSSSSSPHTTTSHPQTDHIETFPPSPSSPPFSSFVYSSDHEDSPLPSSLLIPLPPLLSPPLSSPLSPPLLSPAPPLSPSCLSLLSSLLDVRIHKRLGVGPNYPPFESHLWFISNSLSLPSLPSLPSPLQFNSHNINTYHAQQLLKINMDDTRIKNKKLLDKNIEEYLQQIQFSNLIK